ncbi:MAG: Phosphoglycolate phosphatase [Acidimicrobiales bacterium]|nr:MAG: HAD family hydrolase [Actinomycetota bacterium]MBV6507252.1 Phosphoglycolate phosphatase [Acidimicrobiales bacterium]RIK04138.1 MAG: hypothetical protein DCC48_14575 [Acidobacteriota bacterium]
MSGPIPVFDLDGTLLDSDTALMRPFLQLGVPRSEITFGHPIEIECTRLGIRLDDYLSIYDISAAQPFPGVDQLLGSLSRWGICSNKHRTSGTAELERLGWHPEVATFSDDYGGGAKHLGPVLDALDVAGSEIVFVGDTEHDRHCAEKVAAGFGYAGWNPRVSSLAVDGVRVFSTPGEILDLIGHR